jgi:hypothetical protein
MRLAYSDDPVAAVETERTKNAVAERKAEQSSQGKRWR